MTASTDTIQERVTQIDRMSRMEMASTWRHAPSGHPLLQGEVGDYFKQRFFLLGGMTPAISKAIGWR